MSKQMVIKIVSQHLFILTHSSLGDEFSVFDLLLLFLCPLVVEGTLGMNVCNWYYGLQHHWPWGVRWPWVCSWFPCLLCCDPLFETLKMRALVEFSSVTLYISHSIALPCSPAPWLWALSSFTPCLRGLWYCSLCPKGLMHSRVGTFHVLGPVLLGLALRTVSHPFSSLLW